MRVSFVTTNPIKVDSVLRVLQARGIDVDVRNLDIPEIQAETAAEVAAAKATEAFHVVGAPVLVNDFAFHIDDLDGFPGAFVKHETRRLGLAGYFRLLERPDGRLGYRCRLSNALAYMDGALQAPKVYERSTLGVLSPEAYGLLPSRPKEKEAVTDVFIPDGETVPIGRMSPARFERWRARPEHERFYHDFADWFLARGDAPSD